MAVIIDGGSANTEDKATKVVGATADNLASLTSGGDLADSGVAKTAVGNATKLQARALASTAPNDGQAVVWSDSNNQWEPGDVAADTSALLPKSAGSGEALTGTLYLDPGSDDSANVLRIPTASANNGDVLLNINRATFSGTEDVTWNLGFNQDAAGSPVDVNLHMWYMQMEHDYNDGGGNWCEFHLNLRPVGGSTFRPVEFKYEKDGSEGGIVWRAKSVVWQDIAGSGTTLSLAEIGTAAATVTLRNIIKMVPINSTTISGWYIEGPSYNLDYVTAGNANRYMRGNNLLFYNNANTLIFHLDTTASSGFGISRINTRLHVTGNQTTTMVLYVKGPASHTGDLAQFVDFAGAVQNAIGPAGQIKTNQAAANTATPSGATAYQLPIYNAAGTLLGYIPVYGSAWT